MEKRPGNGALFCRERSSCRLVRGLAKPFAYLFPDFDSPVFGMEFEEFVGYDDAPRFSEAFVFAEGLAKKEFFERAFDGPCEEVRGLRVSEKFAGSRKQSAGRRYRFMVIEGFSPDEDVFERRTFRKPPSVHAHEPSRPLVEVRVVIDGDFSQIRVFHREERQAEAAFHVVSVTAHAEERKEERRHDAPRPEHPRRGLDEKVDVGISVGGVHREGIAYPDSADSREFHENAAEFFRAANQCVFIFRPLRFRAYDRIESPQEIPVSEIGERPRDSAYGVRGSIFVCVRV